MHSTATHGIPSSLQTLKTNSFKCILTLSVSLLHLTYMSAYVPFTPSKSDQCLHPPYYRSCWHGVSRCFFFRYTQILEILLLISCSLTKELYNPKAFIAHTASLRQPFGHCEKFSTAASHRSLGSISVPVLAVSLSTRLDVLALVSHYLTNKLISHEPLPYRKVLTDPPL